MNVLDALVADHPRLRVVHLAQNQGKANALRIATLAKGYSGIRPLVVERLVRPQERPHVFGEREAVDDGQIHRLTVFTHGSSGLFVTLDTAPGRRHLQA